MPGDSEGVIASRHKQGSIEVISSSTKRRVLSWISLAFIGLALSVFGWGTGYKLSLYYPPSSSVRLMPHAKLLSKNEQDPPKDKTLAGRINGNSCKSKTSTLLTLLFVYAFCAAALCVAPVVSQREREASRQRHLRHRASLTFFFVLPPPTLA